MAYSTVWLHTVQLNSGSNSCLWAAIHPVGDVVRLMGQYCTALHNVVLIALKGMLLFSSVEQVSRRHSAKLKVRAQTLLLELDAIEV